VLAQKHDEDEQPLPTPSAATVTALFNAAPIASHRHALHLLAPRHAAARVDTPVIADDARPGAALRLGVFSGISKSRLAFSGGSQGTINSFYIGGYHTWLRCAR
jgi:hypothetical protein